MKTAKLYSMLAVALTAMASFTACDDDDAFSNDGLKNPAMSPIASESGSSVSTLSFVWDPVEGAIQYGYALFDEVGNSIADGTTIGTSAKFSKLRPATTYTLKVYAFTDVNGNQASSPAYVMTATTAAVDQLSSPENIVYTYAGGESKITWDAVENASSYEVQLSCPSDTVYASVITNEVVLREFKHLEYKLSVTAVSGNEAYTDSYPAETKIDVAAETVWTVEGAQKVNMIGQEYTATLIAYDDATYKLASWFGVEGYDLYFKLGEGNVVIPWGDYEQDGDVYVIPTGLASIPAMRLYTTDDAASVFDGNYDDGGSIIFNTSGYAGVNDPLFTWVANLKVVYSVKGTGHCSITGADYEATFTLYNNGNGVIEGWYGVEGYNLEFTSDENGIITGFTNGIDGWGSSSYEGIETGLEDYYYMYCYFNKDRSYVTGDGASGTVYIYTYNGGYGNYTFTWSNGLINANGKFNLSATGQSYNAKLVVNNDGTGSLLNWCGIEGYNLDFTVDENLVLTGITNGYEGWGGEDYECLFTGLDDVYYLYVYFGPGLSYIDKDNKTLYLSTYYSSDAVDTFTW